MRRPTALTLALLAALPAPALAAVARPTSVEALARDADAVVRATVEARESRWAADGRHLYTLVTLRVAEVWRGAAPGRVVVRVPGGEVGDFGQRVDGAPAFDAGEDVVVFLAARPGAEWRVQGLALGKFRVEAGEARPALEAFSFADGALPAGERRVGAMAVGELERRVRSAR